MILNDRKICTDVYRIIGFLVFLLWGDCHIVRAESPQKLPVSLNEDGKLVYAPDSKGNCLIDFSYCGYKASEVRIPVVPVKIVVPIIIGDATEKLQKAIDYVSSLPLDVNGFRGAVLLQRGTYKLNGRLKIKSSGVVLRGSGIQNDGTIIIAAGKDRETLIRVVGAEVNTVSEPHNIQQNYVPVNSRKMIVEGAPVFQKGQSVFIRRPSTQAWIDLLQMKSFGGETEWLGWKPGEHDIVWDREISDIKGDTLFFDAPITTALDVTMGRATVSAYQWTARINHVGIENFSIVSDCIPYNKRDEDHCWMGVTFENTRDAWVRQVTFRHLAGSAVVVYESASRITVEDCASFEPVSEIGGMRRNTFFTSGQQILFRNLYSEFGYHDFGTGFCAAGPNAFVRCESHLPYSFSGGLDSWTSGVLFDMVNVDGNALSFKNREQDGYGAGWTAANSVFWECAASRIECYSPPGAENYAFAAFAQFAGNGVWVSANEHVKPRSLFYAQLLERIGKDNIPADATSSPPVEFAAGFSHISINSMLTSSEWINQSLSQNPINSDRGGAPSVEQLKLNSSIRPIKKEPKLIVDNGWLVRGRQVLTGNRHLAQLWRENLRPNGIARAKPAIVRNVPGRHGRGYTDNLEELVREMKGENYIGIEHNYSLCYDRRRDDHERTRRIDGDVWAPFYEMPFARSGDGIAWDGLSKYDLTKYNPWYWNRLKQFADLADENGLILVHHNYYQHNAVDAADWADSPWRAANNVNNAEFSEPSFFAGYKRDYKANSFYDLNNPALTDLHKKYIRQCLNNFKDNNEVIQSIGAEFTGPLHFVHFWLDVLQEWENETGKKPIVALSTTKEIQDSIWADPVRSKIIDLIDIRFNRSNEVKPSFDQVYNDVLTFRIKYEGRAVCYSSDFSPAYGWPVFMAGGSLADIPKVQAKGFPESVLGMSPVVIQGQYKLQGKDGRCVLYFKKEAEMDVDLKNVKGEFRVIQIDPEDGSIVGKPKILLGGKLSQLGVAENDIVVWLTKK
jgi:hypothetical protein